MKIAGFKKQSLIDYPGHITSVIFTQGCNFRCGFCHNPTLVLPHLFEKPYDTEDIFSYIDKYKNLLDAVCITGGEPTFHKDLPDVIKQIKSYNLKVKLDSNGSNVKMLERLLDNSLLDFIAMDIKHILSFEKYNIITGNVISKSIFNNILRSIDVIENSGIDHEFRTTVIKGFHSEADILSLKDRFKDNYKTQIFNPDIVLDKDNFKEENIMKLN